MNKLYKNINIQLLLFCCLLSWNSYANDEFRNPSFAPQENVFACNGLIDSSLIERTAINCGQMTSICLPHGLTNLATYTITDNGNPYNGGLSVCDFDTSFAYTYASLPGGGNTGPYLIDSWTVNGDVFDGAVIDMAELTDSMNSWDPLGNWALDGATSSIRGGLTGTNYGDLNLTEMASSTSASLEITTSLNPNGTTMSLDTGYHQLIFLEPIESCLDTLVVIIDCFSCDQLYSGETVIDANDCEGSVPICMDLPFGAVNDYTITDNGAVYTGGIASCAADIIYTYDFAPLPGGGNLGPYLLQNWLVNGSVFIGTFNNMSDLVDSMNVWDVGANWQLDLSNSTITGGHSANSYSNMLMLQIITSMSGSAILSSGNSPGNVELALNLGDHQLILTNNINGCMDTTNLEIHCGNCDSVFDDTPIEVEAVHCDSSAAICLPIPFAEVNDYVFTLDGALFSGAFSACTGAATQISLDTGTYQLIVRHSLTTCIDSVTIQVNCIPPIICTDFLPTESVQLRVDDCSEMAELCVEIPAFELSNYTITDNFIPYNPSGEACTAMTSRLLLSSGIHELIFTENSTGCTDTIQALVACLETENLSTTLMVGATDTLCLSTTELVGNVLSFDNTCPGSSGEMAILTVDATNFCVYIEGIEAGTESACLLICDDLGYCDTTYLDFTVEALPIVLGPLPIVIDDEALTTEMTAVTFDILGNDTLHGTLDTLYLGTAGNGVATLNTDQSVTYMPAATFCGLDQLNYTLCNENGCAEGTINLEVTCIEAETETFTGFSPNGDGKNDYFVIGDALSFPQNQLYIYNKWGNLIFHQEGYQNDWTALWKGVTVPDGTYFYLFDEGNGNLRTGYLQIQR